MLKRTSIIIFVLFFVNLSFSESPENVKANVCAELRKNENKYKTLTVVQKMTLIRGNGKEDSYFIINKKKDNMQRIDLKNQVTDSTGFESYIYINNEIWKIKDGMKEKINKEEDDFIKSGNSSLYSIISDKNTIMKQEVNNFRFMLTRGKIKYSLLFSSDSFRLKEIEVKTTESTFTTVIKKYSDFGCITDVWTKADVFSDGVLQGFCEVIDVAVNEDIEDEIFDVKKIKNFSIRDAIRGLF